MPGGPHDHGRVGISPGGVSQFVAIVVEAEIEAGAGAQLEQSQRQACLFGYEQTAAKDGGAARHFVGLGRVVEVVVQEIIPLTDRFFDRLPDFIRRGLMRGIGVGQVGCLTGAGEGVKAGGGAKRQRVGSGISRP